MTDIKRIVEGANFSIAQGTPYEAIVCKGQAYKNFAHRMAAQQYLGARDMLIDAVTLDFRPTLKINKWRKVIPEAVMKYCYDCVPFRKMTFVIRMDDGQQGDYLVCVVEDRNVKKTLEYEDLYKTAIAKIAPR